MQDTSLDRAILRSARLDGASAEGAELDHIDLRGATLEGADLTGATLTNAKLDNADLRDAALRGVDLRGSSFYATDLRGADLSTANLGGVDPRYICWNEGTRWPKDFIPGFKLCKDRSQSAAQAENWQVTTDITELGADGHVSNVVDHVDDTSGSVTLLVRIVNIGSIPIRAVAVATHLTSTVEGVSWEPTRVRLINGNYPNGYDFSPDAIMDHDETVSLDIGNYNAGSNAFVEIALKPRHRSTIKCGPVTLSTKTFMTPADRGSVFDETNTSYDVTTDCSH